MRIITADILSSTILENADAICFTSNGVVKADGTLVMGAGVALAFKNKFFGIDRVAGRMVKANGNNVYKLLSFGSNFTDICNFPTKQHWKWNSDINLIRQSAKQLMAIANDSKWWKNVYLPAPGVGHGGLSWETQVKPIVESIFDDRIIICFKDEKEIAKEAKDFLENAFKVLK